MSTHFALRTGLAPMPEGRDALLSVTDLGILRVSSGKLGASDPFVALDTPTVVDIPPGDYPVRVTIADVSEKLDGSHLREAYLSVILSDSEPASVELAPGPDGPPPPGYLVGVDAGTVSFVDAEAVASCMPEAGASWYDDVFDTGTSESWFSVMDADSPYPKGTANIVMPRSTAGENVILAHSGWGDGFYPVQQTRDRDGKLVAVHIDLEVVGIFDEPPPSADATTGRNQRPTRFTRIRRWFGRSA